MINNAFLHFVRFLQYRTSQRRADFASFSVTDLGVLLITVENLRNALKAAVAKHSRSKVLSNTINPTDKRHYLKSPWCLETIAMFTGEDLPSNSIEIHSRLRNHIFMKLLFRNSCRSGPITSMTVQEFEKAKPDPVSKLWIAQGEFQK